MPYTPADGDSPLKPLKWYKKLAAGKGRLEAEAFLVEGDIAIGQIAGNSPDRITELLSTRPLPTCYRHYPNRPITDTQLGYISSAKAPQGVIAVVRLPMETYSTELPPNTGGRILLLEDVQDPGNLGSLIRTAASFGFDGIILTQKCADPFSPKVVQSAAGSLLSLWIRRTTAYLELLDTLKINGYSIIAADLDGTADPSVLQKRPKLLLALGNEAAGLSQQVLEAADYRIKIPIMDEKVESLNVAACGAILMYLSRQRR
ncbi:TrmH family RNA methyltransferase [Chloroflexota bacterium]